MELAENALRLDEDRKVERRPDLSPASLPKPIGNRFVGKSSAFRPIGWSNHPETVTCPSRLGTRHADDPGYPQSRRDINNITR